MPNHCYSEVKPEGGSDAEWHNAFSPETSALLKGLGDTPESMQLKAEYMRSLNRLQRGPWWFQAQCRGHALIALDMIHMTPRTCCGK